jgi:CRISPR-associated protein Csx16
MTTWFISGHVGAHEWALRRGIAAEMVAHLDPVRVTAGDKVIGTLPVAIAAEVCAKGAAYWHLTLALPAEARHRELSADDMDRYGAKIEQFDVKRIGG